jgi:CRISPR-associated endoribonuclease Cas6
MLFGRYEFRCRFVEAARLPEYKGSTFRGVFGHALKSVVCALEQQECETCLFRSQCLYTLVFETHLAKPVPPGAKFERAPHPFVFEPPLNMKTDFAPDEPFNFSFLLFGDLNHSIGYFIYTFDWMGRLGVGKKINGRRGQFIIDSVTLNNEVIYTSKTQILRKDYKISHLVLSDIVAGTHKKNTIKISLKTPLRLKYKNDYTKELPFHILVRAMNRRVSALMTIYDEGEPPLDYEGLILKAKAVEMVDADYKWVQVKRFSQRQGKPTPLDGFMGSVTYEGDLGEFMPQIKFCEETHIGKQTAFGLVQIASE